MQLFILLYIEAGSYIQEEEESWEFVVLYVCGSAPGIDFDALEKIRETEA
jgi:hypothetical protein